MRNLRTPHTSSFRVCVCVRVCVRACVSLCVFCTDCSTNREKSQLSAAVQIKITVQRVLKTGSTKTAAHDRRENCLNLRSLLRGVCFTCDLLELSNCCRICRLTGQHPKNFEPVNFHESTVLPSELYDKNKRNQLSFAVRWVETQNEARKKLSNFQTQRHNKTGENSALQNHSQSRMSLSK